jgi:putative ABC transport system substrate-binding protein
MTMNHRRKLLAALGAGVFTSPLAAFAQPQGKVWRIGFLHSESLARTQERVDAFRAGLRELGYEEGKNYAIEFRWADGKNDRLPDLAADLVRLKVDVIVTHGTIPLRAAMNATTTIPIVTATSGDVLAMGLVTNLARPGGNMTGAIFFALELAAKRIELLQDVLPRLTQAAVLVNADSPATPLLLQSMEATARSLKVTLHKFPVRGPQEFDSVFAAMVKKRVGAVAMPDDPMFQNNPKVIAELAAKSKLPSIGSSDVALAGGLMSYGANFPGMFHRAAYFVDKIFKGAKPGDIPIEQATRFELIINKKAAKALGITFPNSILVRADKVIE